MDDRTRRIARAIFGRKSPPPAALNSAERAILRYALELAEDKMASRGNEFTDADRAAVESLKRLAGEEQQS